MEDNQNNGNLHFKRNVAKKSKVSSYLTVFSFMLMGLLIIFSYVYQSTKQVYLNYEIVNLNKEINDLNIRLTESKVENERLQTNENIEKVASEKLGMSYEKSDRVVVVKETEEAVGGSTSDDQKKIKIFMRSLYDELNNQLSQFSLDNLKEYFSTK